MIMSAGVAVSVEAFGVFAVLKKKLEIEQFILLESGNDIFYRKIPALLCCCQRGNCG